MEDQFDEEREEELRRQRRAELYARARREKEQQMWFRKNILYCVGGVVCAIALIGIIVTLVRLRLESGDGDAPVDNDGQGVFQAERVVPGGTGIEEDFSLDAAPGDTQPSEATGESVPAEKTAPTEELESSVEPEPGVEPEPAGEPEPETTGEPESIGEPEPTAEPEAAATKGNSVTITTPSGGMIDVGSTQFLAGYTAKETQDTRSVDTEQVFSTYAILIDETNNTIVAEQNAHTIISPASMTKILTLLVAAEHVTDMEDTFTMTIDITDYAYVHDCSIAGFSVGEQIPVKDLFYGTILPSGADAAVALATYVAGSQEAFVELMNDKLEELGLSDTAHFTNCVGLYDEEHHCTIYDMAMILKAAVENDFCREVLSAHTYTTAQTPEHPDGIFLSNWFLRRIEDKDTGGEVLCAKTGFVNESGSCAASYQITNSGTPYICVTADAHSSWRCIYDHVAMYNLYAE